MGTQYEYIVYFYDEGSDKQYKIDVLDEVKSLLSNMSDPDDENARWLLQIMNRTFTEALNFVQAKQEFLNGNV